MSDKEAKGPFTTVTVESSYQIHFGHSRVIKDANGHPAPPDSLWALNVIRNLELHAEIQTQVQEQTVRAHNARAEALQKMERSVHLVRALGVARPQRRRATLHGLQKAVDWVPAPGLRKTLRKLVADQAAEIIDARRARRHALARWQEVCSWAMVIWYVVVSPLTAIRGYLRGKFGLSE